MVCADSSRASFIEVKKADEVNFLDISAWYDLVAAGFPSNVGFPNDESDELAKALAGAPLSFTLASGFFV